MHLESRRDLVDRFLGFDRLESDLRLELAGEFPTRPLSRGALGLWPDYSGGIALSKRTRKKPELFGIGGWKV